MPARKRNPRTWHTGRPPHVGWWQASTGRDKNVWRWWNGRLWSSSMRFDAPAHLAVIAAYQAAPHLINRLVKWTYYWPANARVPRINPKKIRQNA